MNRPHDLDLRSLVAAWEPLAPPDDFADRVLSACAPPARRSTSRRPLLLFAAVAIATLAALPFVLSRSIERRPAATALTIEQDLGVERD